VKQSAARFRSRLIGTTSVRALVPVYEALHLGICFSLPGIWKYSSEQETDRVRVFGRPLQCLLEIWEAVTPMSFILRQVAAAHGNGAGYAVARRGLLQRGANTSSVTTKIIQYDARTCIILQTGCGHFGHWMRKRAKLEEYCRVGI
jgi:hypothetical protein